MEYLTAFRCLAEEDRFEQEESYMRDAMGKRYLLSVLIATSLLLVNILLTANANASSSSSPENIADKRYRQWIEEMKTSDRGPFLRIRWYCNDGSVLPPKAYACVDRGGGHQHGQLNDKTVQLRAQGYRIATLLAGVDTGKLSASEDFIETWNHLLIEKFLMAIDNGWIMRRAVFYRGAIQEEDERAAARMLLIEMAAKPEWVGLRYPSLRTGVQLLPHGNDTASVQKVRRVSASLSDQDAGFKQIRGKIHGAPDKDDARLVRDYAAQVVDASLRQKYENLAIDIDLVYQSIPLQERLSQDANLFANSPGLQALLQDAARKLVEDASDLNVYALTSKLLADLRDSLPGVSPAAARLDLLDLSLAVETENFRASTTLRNAAGEANRRALVELLGSSVQGAYGTGMINGRERNALQETLTQLNTSSISLNRYLKNLRYLGRVPGWGTQGMRFHFYESMQKLAQIEPNAILFIQDQLRGSPLLFYSRTLDSMQRDANKIAGVHHQMFGQELGVGFRALNPGLARGVLHVHPDPEKFDAFQANGIYLLPETVADLPPIAGIITAGEGNPLSHIQLLARNLGIPNVSVDEQLLPAFDKHDGKDVVMAVSPAGLVELSEYGPRWRNILGNGEVNSEALIRPDMEKLDLNVKEFVSLDELRASDSGRIVGPKAANLGELRHHFPEAVAVGIAIPFGQFRAVVLDKPYKDSGKTVFEWMVAEYKRLHNLPGGSEQQERQTELFRAELYELILNTRFTTDFIDRLRLSLENTIGPVGSYGLFVRSDTNVEDLPGFTGAGLNLTVVNVVGIENLVKAIPRVWASPFTQRAFAWRQSLMDDPENVYPAVLLLKSVSNDKSGVMVTQDIETGDRTVLSVAVNEGVGGAVDGQSAESLRINLRDGSVRLLASATAVLREVPRASGGVDKLPVSGDQSVLKPDEISQLIAFAKELPSRFPPITDADGNLAPADVEFGFLGGKLQLFQLRPFLESRDSQGRAYLSEMDRTLEGKLDKLVNMEEMPGS